VNQADIRRLLDRLDPHDPNHWIDDGLPRMDVIHQLQGGADHLLTRDEVDRAAPDFRRPKLPTAFESSSAEGAAVVAAVVAVVVSIATNLVIYLTMAGSSGGG